MVRIYGPSQYYGWLTELDLFNTNASIVRDLAKAAAEHSPEANILIISNPVCDTFATATGSEY
jgi:malate/lactate dehydrogenase